MDGIMAAQFAAGGFVAAVDLLEPGGALATPLIQDKSMTIRPADFSGWEILNNSFKPYAACHLTHPAVDAARGIDKSKYDLAKIRSIHAEVGALANQMTGGKSGAPTTGLEGKFDLKYCVALALHGGKLSAADFRDPLKVDPAVAATAAKVTVEAKPDQYGFASARLTMDTGRGDPIRVEVPVAKGHPENPMTWEDMHDKFEGLAQSHLGSRTEQLFGQLREFGNGKGLAAIRGISV
jgi:2-methylcitrate dehydratase PrpD